MGIKDWVHKQIQKIVDWFWDKIVRPVTDYLRDLIDKITVQIRIWRHNLNQLLAKWFSNDLFFLAFVAAVSVLIFTLPAIIRKLGETSVFKFLKSATEWIRKETSKLIDLQVVINLKLISDILKVVWPDYKAAMMSINEVISQIAAELGEGSAFIHAYLSSARMIYMGTAAIVGSDMKTAEFAWYKDATDFTGRINDDFNKYARDPSLVYYDFVNDFLIPAAEDYQTVNKAELDQIRENYNRLLEIENGFKLVTDGIEATIEQMPGVIEEQFRERWDDVHDAINDVLAAIDDAIWPVLNDLYAAFDEHNKMQQSINDRVVELFGDPTVLLNEYLTLDKTQQDGMAGLVEKIVLDGVQPELDSFGSGATFAASRLQMILDETYGTIPSPPALRMEPSAVKWRAAPAPDIPSPFVGEY